MKIRSKLLTVSLVMLFITLTQNALSQGFFDTAQDNAFLPVEEAYKVTPFISTNQNDTQAEFKWTAEKGYYLYKHQFKLIIKNDTQGFDIPLSIEPGKKKYDEYFQKELEVYYNAVAMTANLPELSLPYEITLQSQGCADAGLCYPPHKHYFRVEAQNEILPIAKGSFKDVPITIIEAPENTVTSTTTSSQPLNWTGIIALIFSAFLGGLILNLLPCVFPVLSLKALSLLQATEDSHNNKAHGVAYTVGVVLSFIALASPLIFAKALGGGENWGYQLQNPSFLTFMVYLFFVMGLALYGYITLAGSWMGWGQKLTSGNSLQSSFFTGVLAVLVASPCAGPFMGAAIGLAISQPAIITLLVFASLGFGLAFPFLLLSYSPKLASYLPRPGAWMETLKQLFSFPIFITALWLLWVLGRKTNESAAIAVAAGCLSIVFGLWLLKLATHSRPLKWLKNAMLVLAFAVPILLMLNISAFTAPPKYPWETYSPKALSELRAQNIPVLLDVTADWCVTCKVNESTSLNRKKVRDKAKELGVVMMQADYTNTSPEITKLLAEYNRNAVPLYLMYPADASQRAKILPQILTPQIVIEAIENSLR